MEGIVEIPLGIFDTAKELSPKAEIWTAEKLLFLKTDWLWKVLKIAE